MTKPMQELISEALGTKSPKYINFSMSWIIYVLCIIAAFPTCLASKYGHFQISEWILFSLFIIMLLLIRYTCRQMCKTKPNARPPPVCSNYPQPPEVILTLSLNQIDDIRDRVHQIDRRISVTPPPAYSVAVSPPPSYSVANTPQPEKF